MRSNQKKRLESLEAHQHRRTHDVGEMTVAMWRTYHETGEVPPGPAGQQWLKQAQARCQQAAETAAIFED